MTHTATALYSFFSGFGLPAYTRNNIPRDAQLPYITYEVAEPDPLSSCDLHAWVFYRDTSMSAISGKVDEIRAAVGPGLSLPTPSGALHLFRHSRLPFAQEQPDPDAGVRAMYLSLILHANTD